MVKENSKTINDFNKLEVWKKANEAAIKIYKLTKQFPKDERFGLTDQVRRAISSVSANIAEGFGRYHTNDKIRFYYTARGSISESKSHIYLAKGLGYISDADASELAVELESIKMMINGMINSIRKRALSF